LTREPNCSDRHLAAHLRTLSQLIPGIAHDLRAPVNAMLFNLEVLRETVRRQAPAGPAPHEARLLRYTEVLGEEVHRLHERLEVLLAYLRPPALRQEPLSLALALRELETVLVPTARKRQIAVRCEEAGEDAFPGEAVPVRQALLQVGALALARVAPQGRLALSGGRHAGGVRVRIAGGPALAGPTLAPEGDDPLAAAHALVTAAGGALREIDDSASNEPGATYEVEFPVSGNAPAANPIPRS